MPPARIFKRLLLTAVAICWLTPLGLAQRRQIRVSAAADLQTAMPELAKSFEAQTGVSVDVVYGSSGNYFGQIQNGAPLDVFFSADSQYPGKLEESGFAEPHSAVIYGIGSIVLWMPANAACNLEADGWKCLQHSSVKKI